MPRIDPLADYPKEEVLTFRLIPGGCSRVEIDQAARIHSEDKITETFPVVPFNTLVGVYSQVASPWIVTESLFEGLRRLHAGVPVMEGKYQPEEVLSAPEEVFSAPEESLSIPPSPLTGSR